MEPTFEQELRDLILKHESAGMDLDNIYDELLSTATTLEIE